MLDAGASLAINVQRNRILCAEALETAAALAPRDLAAARETLTGAIASIEHSPSARDRLCVALLHDLGDALRRLANQQTAVAGVARMQHHANQHQQQRTTVSSSNAVGAYGANYAQCAAIDGYNALPL